MARGSERRARSKSPVRRVAVVETEAGNRHEIQEKSRRKNKEQLESAEHRRSRDTAVEAVASTLSPQQAGQPPKGQAGPRAGSLRHAEKATGGLVGRSALARGAVQLKETGAVRDQRKHNSKESNLSEAQLDSILRSSVL